VKKNNIILFVIIIAIILIISIIFYFKTNNSLDEKTARCIASKSQLYVSKTCSHCAEQKQILGDYFNYFNIIDCLEEIEKCENILAVPTWIINNKQYTGVKSLKELKRLTNC